MSLNGNSQVNNYDWGVFIFLSGGVRTYHFKVEEITYSTQNISLKSKTALRCGIACSGYNNMAEKKTGAGQIQTKRETMYCTHTHTHVPVPDILPCTHDPV